MLSGATLSGVVVVLPDVLARTHFGAAWLARSALLVLAVVLSLTRAAALRTLRLDGRARRARLRDAPGSGEAAGSSRLPRHALLAAGGSVLRMVVVTGTYTAWAQLGDGVRGGVRGKYFAQYRGDAELDTGHAAFQLHHQASQWIQQPQTESRGEHPRQATVRIGAEPIYVLHPEVGDPVLQ